MLDVLNRYSSDLKNSLKTWVSRVKDTSEEQRKVYRQSTTYKSIGKSKKSKTSKSVVQVPKDWLASGSQIYLFYPYIL